MGTQRCPMETDRTGFATAATPPMVEAVPGRTREQCCMGFCGCWVPERSGAPNKYAPYQTCHRGFQQWVRSGKLERILRELAGKLRVRGTLDLEEAFIDASFTGAKKGPRGRAYQTWGRKSSFSPTLASGPTFRLAASFSPACDPLGVPRRELLRHGPPGCTRIVLRHLWTLLVAQRHHGIDLDRAVGWDERRQNSNRRKQQCHRYKGHRISRTHTEQQTGHESR